MQFILKMKTNFLALFAAIVVAPFVIKGAPTNTGKFQISDNGVHGEGTYQTNGNGNSMEIGLRLVIGPDANKTTAQGWSGVVEGRTPDAHFVFSDEQSQFMQNVLQEHNVYRAIHGAPPLKLNTQMSVEASAFAQELADNGSLVHSVVSSRPNQSESLAMGCSKAGPGITAKGVVKRWYDEVCKHNFVNHDFQKPSGHFINLAWKPTEQIGVAEAHGKKWDMNCTWVVARYKPRVQLRPEVEHNFGLDVDKGSFDPAYCNSITEGNKETENKGWSSNENSGRSHVFRTTIPRVMVA